MKHAEALQREVLHQMYPAILFKSFTDIDTQIHMEISKAIFYDLWGRLYSTVHAKTQLPIRGRLHSELVKSIQ